MVTDQGQGARSQVPGPRSQVPGFTCAPSSSPPVAMASGVAPLSTAACWDEGRGPWAKSLIAGLTFAWDQYLTHSHVPANLKV